MSTGINDVTCLIDSVVQQTMVLIAQLATVGGNRAQLTKVANQVFLDLVKQLESQGLGQKVIADMFGLALRTYQRRRQRLQESLTDVGCSLWGAVFAFVSENDRVTRNEVLRRFRRDDEILVGSILNDLVESDVIERDGYADATTYRVTESTRGLSESNPLNVAADLAWVLVYQNAPISYDELIRLLPMDETIAAPALQHLLEDGRIGQRVRDGITTYHCDEYVIPYGSSEGWVAAVFDHYQALVGAICAKLDQGKLEAAQKDAIGGSTFNFDIWENHPCEDEVLGLLSEFRSRTHELRSRIADYNRDASPNAGKTKRVVLYMGQNVISDDDE